MNRILVWDSPTRLFHWIFTGCVIGALGLSLLADDDGSLFCLHMTLGLVAGFTVLLRLVWGLFGSRYARFRSFLFGPKALLAYGRGVVLGTGDRHIGHNPGSAYAILAMLLLSLGLAVTGLFLSSWRALKEVHEVMAYGMLAVVCAHVLGIVLHIFRHRENIALSMIDGRKPGAPEQAIRSTHALAGIAFLALTAGWAGLVLNGHDEQGGRLTLFGQSFRLGKAERGTRWDGEDGREYRRRQRDSQRLRESEDDDDD